jgi:hypothetical protein
MAMTQKIVMIVFTNFLEGFRIPQPWPDRVRADYRDCGCESNSWKVVLTKDIRAEASSLILN